MTDDNEKRPEPRTAEEIFADLRELAQSEGALHEISALTYRDWSVTIDMKEARVKDDEGYRWSTERLNKNEIMLLLGLMVQEKTEKTYASIRADDQFSGKADRLLREFHDRIIKDAELVFNPENMVPSEDRDDIGLLAREAIYYGAEGFYIHQFKRYARLRYKNDATWLLQNIGISIRPMLEIADYIATSINKQMTVIAFLRSQGQTFNKGELTNSLLISKADIKERFGSKADAFLQKFATPVNNTNTGFTDAFLLNAVAIAPLLDLGEHLYLGNQYRLFEAIYEGPFYWMVKDESYEVMAADHRGQFLEKSTAYILQSVFGKENVYENVTVDDGTKDTAGEIDVLVVYGEFVLVVQAKSKRITQKARSGDKQALETDFKGAIQDPYNQALKCIEKIRGGAICTTIGGRKINFPQVSRVFPLVILSDSFPSATFLSGAMLRREDAIAPVIWDIGELDCITRILSNPIEILYYLKCRSEVFDNVLSDSEYNYLGYHLRAKLVLPDDANFMYLDRDFATVIDDFMISVDVGLNPLPPKGVLEIADLGVMSDVLKEIKNGAVPELAAVVFDLYEFSGKALQTLSETLLAVREEIKATGKAIKAFSILTPSGGITYAVTKSAGAKAMAAASAIGAKHKYDQKSDRWYVILDCVNTAKVIDGLLPLIWPWEENEDDAARSREVALMFKSSMRELPRKEDRGV